MASTKGRIIRLLSSITLDRAAVSSTVSIGGFQRIDMHCEEVEFTPGSKVQLLLPSNDMRTYTPIPTRNGMVLLGWKHSEGPGARWLASAKVGDLLPFVGPQRSLELGNGPTIIIGDETSVALGASFELKRPRRVHTIIQTNAGEVTEAASSVGLHATDVVGTGDHAATVHHVRTALSTFPNAQIALTGGSDLVIGARNALRNAGISNIKTKAYWVPGKSGLD